MPRLHRGAAPKTGRRGPIWKSHDALGKAHHGFREGAHPGRHRQGAAAQALRAPEAARFEAMRLDPFRRNPRTAVEDLHAGRASARRPRGGSGAFLGDDQALEDFPGLGQLEKDAEEYWASKA